MHYTKRFTNDFDALSHARDYIGKANFDKLKDEYLADGKVFDVASFAVRRELFQGLQMVFMFGGVAGRPVTAFARLVFSEHKRRLREINSVRMMEVVSHDE